MNDKADEIHTQVKELDKRMCSLVNKVDINHALVMKRIAAEEERISTFKIYQDQFNVTIV